MDKQKTATVMLFASLVLGLAADLLLRWIPWGVNAALWTALFLAAAAVASRMNGRRVHAFSAVAAMLAALGLVWRASPVLAALDVVLLVLFLPMLGLGARGVAMASTGLSGIGIALATTALQSVAGGPQLVLTDLESSNSIRRVQFRRGAGVAVRGAAMATPALLLFGALLTSADTNFARVLERLIVFDVRELLLHLFVTLVAAGICAGFLRSFAFSGAAPMPSRPSFLRLPTAETNVAIGLVNTLFATFVAVQFRHFFGSSSLTHSENARRGFFELVWVVALVVPMLLVGEWLVDKENLRGLRVFRALALAQIALVLVIGASAYRRMQLYRDEFGLTQLRFYTTAFMLWTGAVLVWLAATVLTGRRERFAMGVLATAVLAVVTLHAINPDALIVKTNLERAMAGRRAFDSHYAALLSDDAAPVIYANAHHFRPDDLRAFRERPRTAGWRTWNASRAAAR